MPGDASREPEVFPIVEIEETDSTNSEAMRRCAGGVPQPMWIMAHRQTAGRGRRGRTWIASEGNLTASLLLMPSCDVKALPQLSFVAGVALLDALAPLRDAAGDSCKIGLSLKWPNDILDGDAKLGGILIESTTEGARTSVVVGIGVNVASAPVLADRRTTAVSAWGRAISSRDVLQRINQTTCHWLRVWDEGRGFPAIRLAWLARAHPLGTMLQVAVAQEICSGAFAGIDETGALLIDSVPPTSGTPRRFTFGDVSVLPRT